MVAENRYKFNVNPPWRLITMSNTEKTVKTFERIMICFE